jgi:hypothetical protein
MQNAHTIPTGDVKRESDSGTQGSVHVLRGLAAAEAAENRFLLDFSDSSIFDFFDSIDPKQASATKILCVAGLLIRSLRRRAAMSQSGP